jgi:chaperonin GroES
MAKTSTNSVSAMKPTPGYIFIEPKETTKQTTSGIYLPDSATGDKPQEGTVLAVGAPTFVSDHEIKSPAKVGDVIIYKKWGGNEVKVDNKEYIFVKFEDILAVLN